MKQVPHYDPQTQPDGLINLSGALNNLMQDWWDDNFRETPISIDSSECTLSMRPLMSQLEMANTVNSPTVWVDIRHR